MGKLIACPKVIQIGGVSRDLLRGGPNVNFIQNLLQTCGKTLILGCNKQWNFRYDKGSEKLKGLGLLAGKSLTKRVSSCPFSVHSYRDSLSYVRQIPEFPL